MAHEVSLPADLSSFNRGATEELRVALERYREDLAREASRLEAAANTAGQPEITSSMVKDADLLLRKGYRRLKKSRAVVVAQITAPVSGFLTGLLFDRQALQVPLNLVLFVALLTVTIVATVVTAVKE